MDIEETTPNGSKKFLKIALGVLGVLVVLLGAALVLTALKNAKQTEVQTTVSTQKVLTQEEKLQILHDIALSIPKDTPGQQAEKLSILHDLAKKAPVDTASVMAEKLRILHALASSTKQ